MTLNRVMVPELYRHKTLPRHCRHVILSLNGSFSKLFHNSDHLSPKIINNEFILALLASLHGIGQFALTQFDFHED